MKKKLIVIFILTLIVCMSFSVSGVAFADTLQSNEDISYVERNYYINEFNNFLEYIGEDKLSIEDINCKILYDFSENPIFILTYAQDYGYMISNRETGTSFERSGIGNNPYKNHINELCYYVGVGNYYYYDNGSIKDIFNNKSILDEVKLDLQINIDKIVSFDKEENGELSLRAKTSTSDRLNNSVYISTRGKNYFAQGYNTIIDMGNSQYDRLFPENDGDSCGIVAAIQLLQYLDRVKNIDTTSAFREKIQE